MPPLPATLGAALVALAIAASAGCGGEGGEDAPDPAPDAPATGEAADAPASGYGAGQFSGGEPQGAGAPEDRRPSIDEVIAAVLTRSGTPEQGCATLVTESFVRDAYGDRAGCEAARAAPGALARSVEVSRVREAGEVATALAVPSGGPYDGVEVEIGLVADPAREDGWLVDSLFADVPAGP